MAGVEGVEDKITADMVVCVCVEAWCKGESWGENKRATMGQGPGSEIQEKGPSEGSGEGRRLADTGSGAGLRSVCFNSTTKLSPCPVRRLHNALQVYDAGVGGVHPMSVPHNWNLLRASGGLCVVGWRVSATSRADHVYAIPCSTTRSAALIFATTRFVEAARLFRPHVSRGR